MERRMKRGGAGFVLLTVFLVLFSAFCIGGTVISQSEIGERELENYYREQEKELVQEVRDYLQQAGFQNSGVMLTRVVDGDGSREYTLTVHHSKIDKMDDVSRESLGRALETLDFTADNCTFYHEFLITD